MAEERVQRRLAAILAADFVGYSRMMREGEKVGWKCSFEIVAQYVKFLVPRSNINAN